VTFMPEPIVTGAVTKSGEAGSERSEAIDRSLLVRVLGTSADAVGETLRRYTEYRLHNVQAIVERAEAKCLSPEDQSSVNLRVAHVVLEDGSYCDDELVASYLGGLLAGSRTPQGRDDRAVTWSKAITGLSSLQIRAHYLLYREWAARLRIIAVYDLGVEAGRTQATMEISSGEFVKLLVYGSEVDENDAMSHAIGGLMRVGLLDDKFFFNDKLVKVMPSIMGLELYGWAQGLPGLSPRRFASKAQLINLEDAIPRLSSVTFPELPERADATVDAGRKQAQLQIQRERQGRRTRDRDTSG
jgi:hypothetical protein